MSNLENLFSTTMSESSGAALGVAQFCHFYHFRRLMSCNDHLTDTLTRFNGLGFAAEVDEYHAHLSAVVRVDRPRGVEYRQSALERQTATRTYLRLKTYRQFDEQTRRNQSPLHRRQSDRFVDVTPYIHARCLRTLVLRQRILALINNL